MNKTDKTKLLNKVKEVRAEVKEKLKKELAFVAEIFFNKSQELGGEEEKEVTKKTTLSDKAIAIKQQVKKLNNWNEKVAMAKSFSLLLGEEITVDEDEDDEEKETVPGTVLILKGEESEEQAVLITEEGGYGVYFKKENAGATPYLAQISFCENSNHRLATKEEILELVINMEVEAVSAWLNEEYETIFSDLAI